MCYCRGGAAKPEVKRLLECPIYRMKLMGGVRSIRSGFVVVLEVPKRPC